MSIDTSANPATAADEQPETPIEAATRHIYEVEPDGTVKDWRRPDDDTISSNEIACRNGTGIVGDPMLVDGRRGTIEQFMFRPARTGKKSNLPGGWDAVVSFAEGEPRERRVNAAEVDLLLDEITRPEKPPTSQETTTYGVPTEASFGDDDVKLAGDLRQIAVDLIEETGDFPKLRPLMDQIAYFWVKKGGSSGGVPKLAGARLTNKFERKVTKSRLSVWVAADVSRDMLLEREDLDVVLHECLCRIDRDEHGNLRLLAPDFHGFKKNVARYGDRHPRVKPGAEALNIEPHDVRNLRLDLDAVEVETGV